MSVQTRRVILDNNSPSLVYNELWKEQSEQTAHLGTLTTTTATNGSSMTFKFNGTEISANGRANWVGGDEGPPAACTVDSTRILPTKTDRGFRWSWAGKDNTLDPISGTHTFHIDVSIPQESGTNSNISGSVSIDHVQYLPSPDSGLQDRKALVIYNYGDPHIHYSHGNWEHLDTVEAVRATQVGASATVLFTGTQVIWIGSTPASGPRASGQYWMDGGEPVDFDLIPGSEADPPIFGPFHFKVGDLLEGVTHNLTVVYNRPSAPLVIDRLFVQGGNFRIEKEWPPYSSQNPPPPSDPPSGSGSLAGRIAGGVVGAVSAFIALAFLARCLVKRKRRNHNHATESNSDEVSMHSIPRPPSSTSTPATGSHITPQPTSATTNAQSLVTSDGTNDQPFPIDLTALQGGEDSAQAPLATAQSTLVPTSPLLQTHSVTTHNGDVNLASRDVHHHQHTHIYYPTTPVIEPWGQAMSDGMTNINLHLPVQEPYHVHDGPHASQQMIDGVGPVRSDEPWSSSAALVQERHG